MRPPLHRRPLTTIGRPPLPSLQRRRVVSGAGKPLAPVLALLGRLSV